MAIASAASFGFLDGHPFPSFAAIDAMAICGSAFPLSSSTMAITGPHPAVAP